MLLQNDAKTLFQTRKFVQIEICRLMVEIDFVILTDVPMQNETTVELNKTAAMNVDQKRAARKKVPINTCTSSFTRNNN